MTNDPAMMPAHYVADYAPQDRKDYRGVDLIPMRCRSIGCDKALHTRNL